MRRRNAAGSNESFETVPVFTPDPHGAAIFAGITNGTLGHLNTRPVMDTQRSRWTGWTQAPQQLRGSGNLGGGAPRLRPGSTLDQERGDLVAPDAIQQLFQERMTARRFGS